MSRPARRPTLWTLRKASTRISICMSRRLTRTDNVRLLQIFCFRNNYSIPLRRKVSVRTSQRGLRRLILIDTLRRVHNVGFLKERLISSLSLLTKCDFYSINNGFIGTDLLTLVLISGDPHKHSDQIS